VQQTGKVRRGGGTLKFTVMKGFGFDIQHFSIPNSDVTEKDLFRNQASTYLRLRSRFIGL